MHDLVVKLSFTPIVHCVCSSFSQFAHSGGQTGSSSLTINFVEETLEVRFQMIMNDISICTANLNVFLTKHCHSIWVLRVIMLRNDS